MKYDLHNLHDLHDLHDVQDVQDVHVHIRHSFHEVSARPTVNLNDL